NKRESSKSSRLILSKFDDFRRFLNRDGLNESQTIEFARNARASGQIHATATGADEETFDRSDVRGVNAMQVSAFGAQPQSQYSTPDRGRSVLQGFNIKSRFLAQFFIFRTQFFIFRI